MGLMLESISQLGSAFFGLTSDIAPQARAALFKQIHEIVFHGKGGFDWHTVYNMPIWLRKFTFKQLHDFYEEEKSIAENKGKKGSQTVIDSEGKVKMPEMLHKAHTNNPKFNSSSPKNPVKYK